MEHIIYTSEDRGFRRLMGCMAVALLLFYMLCPVAPQRWNDLYTSYGKILIISMAAIYFYKQRFCGPLEVKIVIAYAAWFFISRLLISDIYLQNELELVISRVLCCVMLPVGIMLEAKEREKLLDFVIAIVGAFFFVTALLALYACIFGVYFYIPPENVVFGLDNDFLWNTFIYIIAWESNRTISAVWFYLCWCMMAYEFFHCKNKLWRIPICIAWFIFHLTIAFCFCRSIMLAICANVAMIIIILGLQRFNGKKNRIKLALVFLAALVSILITYKSFDTLTGLSSQLYNALDVDIERSSDLFIYGDDVENLPAEQSFDDPRDLKESVSTMSNRGEIYASVIPTFKEEPLRLLVGKYSSKLMDTPNKYQSYPYFHMHNFLLQTLMLSGAIGLLLALAFTVLMAVKMLRLFFSQSPEASLAVKCLTLPITGIFIYGMFETILFTASADDRSVTDFRELCFFLLAGIFLGYYYEIFPARKKEK